MPVLFISIFILIFSVIIHEIAHGYSAYKLGDTTALDQGRLTLNPIPHIDILGTIVLPFLLVISNAGFLIGWAKPVPYDPRRLRGGNYGEAFVAGAGSLANFLIVVIFSILSFTLIGVINITEVFEIFALIILINLILGIFNMIPFPPLDGSKVLLNLLPYQGRRYFQALFDSFDRYGFLGIFIFIFLFIVFFANIFFGLIFDIADILTPISIHSVF